MLEYKVSELSVVTDDSLEREINRRVAEGWQLDGVRFAMTDASRRPSMAFVFFTRERAEGEPGEDAGLA